MISMLKVLGLVLMKLLELVNMWEKWLWVMEFISLDL